MKIQPTRVPRSLLLLYGYNAAMGMKIKMKTGAGKKYILPPVLDAVEEQEEERVCQGNGCSSSSGCSGVGCPSNNYEDER